METERPVEILLIEDNAADARLLSEVLKEAKVKNIVQVAADGLEAMAYLTGQAPSAGLPGPDLILLDLNLPKKDGREVLAEIKNDQRLKHIPVIVFTGSQSDQDILTSYRLQANCYITKPFGFDNFLKTIKAIEEFWLNTVRLPRPRSDT